MRDDVAHVRDLATGAVASGFAIDPLRIVTAAHAVSDGGEVIATWPYRELSLRGRARHLAADVDVAVIMLNASCSLPVFPMTSTVAFPCRFESFGFRHSEEFIGLHTDGLIVGQTRRLLDDRNTSIDVLQLRTTSIDRGMSGAPVMVEWGAGRAVVGMILGFWNDSSSRDADLGFAFPISEIQRLLQEQEVRLDLNSLETRCLKAVAELALDRFADGAWGRSFEPVRNMFSDDQVDPTRHGGKRALSVTSWAACALSTTVGDYAYDYVKESVPFAMSTYLEDESAFGFVHTQESATPFVEPVRQSIPNPRHTASAAKLILQVDGMSSVVARAITFLVDKQSAEGGWGETLAGEPNSLTCAYVIDFLTACLDHLSQLFLFLTPSTIDALREDLPVAIANGTDWLARRQHPDGTWPYRNQHELPNASAAYSAHVVAFAPEVLTSRNVVGDRYVRFLESELNRIGGIPDRMGGPPSDARALMVAYGLARQDDQRLRQHGLKLANAAFHHMDNETGDMRIRTITNSFLLLFANAAMAGELTERFRIAAGEILNGVRRIEMEQGSDSLARGQWLSTYCAREGFTIEGPETMS